MLIKSLMFVNCLFIFASGMYIEYQTDAPSVYMIITCFVGVLVAPALLFLDDDLF
jgi:hypothetical protein